MVNSSSESLPVFMLQPKSMYKTKSFLFLILSWWYCKKNSLIPQLVFGNRGRFKFVFFHSFDLQHDIYGRLCISIGLGSYSCLLWLNPSIFLFESNFLLQNFVQLHQLDWTQFLLLLAIHQWSKFQYLCSFDGPSSLTKQSLRLLFSWKICKWMFWWHVGPFVWFKLV